MSADDVVPAHEVVIGGDFAQRGGGVYGPTREVRGELEAGADGGVELVEGALE